jgi:putative hydrolase of the HAD superfamily
VVQAVISDFGGVLTTPIVGALTGVAERAEVSLPDLGLAMATVAQALGANPLYELESGRLSEREFGELVGAELSRRRGRAVDFAAFGEALFAGLSPNEPMLDYMRRLRERGYRMAICTNNVREWSERWQALIPAREIFEVIVDSAFVGSRKPDPQIYELTLTQLGVSPEAALFVDDLEVNCTAATELGMRAVWFQNTEQAIADVEAALGDRA